MSLAAGEHSHELSGQVRGRDDPAFGVVVQPVALAGFTLVLALDSLLARGGYLEELILVGMDAAHGGEYLRMAASQNSRRGHRSGQPGGRSSTQSGSHDHSYQGYQSKDIY